MSEQKPTHNNQLTPEQAADVIAHYDRHDNERSIKNNWKRKKSLGQVAFDTTRRMHSILPDGEPLLTVDESLEGLTYYRDMLKRQFTQPVPAEVSEWPIEPTDEQWETIFQLTDTRDIKEAYSQVMKIVVD